MKYWRSIAIALIAACATRSAPPPSNVRTEPPPPPKMKRGEPIPAGALVALSTLTPDLVLATIRGQYISGVELTRRVDGCFALGLQLDVD